MTRQEQRLELQIVGLLARARAVNKNVAQLLGTTNNTLYVYKSKKLLHTLPYWRVAKLAEIAQQEIVFEEKE